MSARRTPPGLKLVDSKPAAAPDAVDATLGGVGLDFEDVPDVLDDRAAAEWRRLGGVYESTPTRFREGDRAILAAFCLAWSVYTDAAEKLTEGLLVQGRSAPDRGRQVKSPAFQVWRDSATQLRQMARELGLTPDARGRSGIREQEVQDDDDDNPFAG